MNQYITMVSMSLPRAFNQVDNFIKKINMKNRDLVSINYYNDDGCWYGIVIYKGACIHD